MHVSQFMFMLTFALTTLYLHCIDILLLQARLTVILNTGLVNMMDLDHRIVPWDTVRSRAVLVSVLHQVNILPPVSNKARPLLNITALVIAKMANTLNIMCKYIN